ncbi:putative pectinesterase/pectinesterase inhibitor 12 [Iris pallida]|uniref:Pectinesterase n=1 Tax=Iris pallida TaxID=29817 RepID=A0AAX6G0Q8_IRIPA|nr:putative pectinesterase/pectinesterase inhibitor 12 [Iris pallida]KAJ6826932.1 putative pectinesterase/pectinesterase inhibitor 12 [Iris pallida]
MASPTSTLLLTSLLLFFTSTTSTSTSTYNLTSIKSLCQSTPYPDSCLHSLKLSVSVTINPSILTILLQTLTAAVSEAAALAPLLHAPAGVVERQRGSLLDCRELHQITIASLEKSESIISSAGTAATRSAVSDVRAHLSAALTNKNTCLEGLSTASGPAKPALVQSWLSAYRHVSNSLSLASRSDIGIGIGGSGRRSRRRLLQDVVDYGEYDPSTILTVAADGTGNFTAINDAIRFAPNMSDERTIIVVRTGTYRENVDVPAYKTNIVLLGEGSDASVVTGDRSAGDGWTTFRSATVAVSGQGFLARDLAFVNTAGPGKGQAVALRVNADLAAVYRCAIRGYQDTLYVHSFRQFYRECDVSGTVDFVFGNAAAVLQNCNLYARLPLRGQSVVVTAQSRDDPDEATGISIQNCSVVPSDELASSGGATRTYLGRPWKPYATTVYIESYIDGMVSPAGWSKWSASDGDSAVDTVYYGEYMNSGPGSSTDGRVTWPGFHVMEYEEAYGFTVSQFIYGDQWLGSTSFPYDDDI